MKQVAVDFITYYDTLLEYYLHIDPSKLDDEEWIKKLAALDRIRTKEASKSY